MNNFIIEDINNFKIDFDFPIKGFSVPSNPKREEEVRNHRPHSVIGITLSAGRLETASNTYQLPECMYFATNEFIQLSCEHGFLIYVEEFNSMNCVGGPIENEGRLKYIDGCTDSLLIPPVIKGDPCLNALYFPKGTKQTFHTHPSFRLGVVLKGKGVCEHQAGESDLIPGKVFMIPKDCEHRFQTDNSELVVVAFHPDSDYGPEHQDHPMINKTEVNGISAKKIKNIQTT